LRKSGSKASIQVIDRAVRLLEVIGNTESATLSALATAANLPLSTTSRILESLIGHGFVARETAGRSYGLGLRLAALGQRARQRQHVTATSRPVLEALAADTGEDVGLSVLVGTVAVVMDWVDGPQPLKIVQPETIGAPEDLHYGAFRKVLLAHQEAAWIESYIAGLTFRKYTSRTITSRPALRRELERIRDHGHAVSIEEKIRDAAAVAAPVFGSDGKIRAAVMISCPVSRFGQARIGSLSSSVMRAAGEITRRLDGIEPPRSGALPESPAPPTAGRRNRAGRRNGMIGASSDTRRV
jgi:DNA-binding IclR family transcriptional regulator